MSINIYGARLGAVGRGLAWQGKANNKEVRYFG